MKTQIPETIAMGLPRSEYEDFPIWGLLGVLPGSSGHQGDIETHDQIIVLGKQCALSPTVCCGDVQGSSIVTEKHMVWSKTDGFESWPDHLPTM